MHFNWRTSARLIILVCLGVATLTVHADRDDRDKHERKDKRETIQSELRYDQRFRHDRYYPRTGYVIPTLPQHYHRVPYHDSYFYYHSGIWYRPSGTRFIVVAPPIGVVVPILPAFYTTIWFGGVPYYYANDVYYVWRPDLNGYQVTNPPSQITEQEPPLLTEELFIYPKQGQTEQQQADDRYACHRWGVSQTGYDPSQPPRDLSMTELNTKRENYQRAMKACLEGRGYSVK